MFIVCAGRSGSTMLHRVLSRHPSVAWLDNCDDRFPNWTLPTKIIRPLRELPMIGPRIASRHGPRECWQFWDHHCPGFSVPERDMLASDVTPEVKRRLPRVLQARTTRRRDRILLKLTGWPRIRFLREIFPDALFLHLVRDGRGVALSVIEQPWWTGARGPEHWAWGPLHSPYRERWEASGKTEGELAGIVWQMTLDAIDQCKREIDPAQLLEVRYEDVCRDPEARLVEILGFFDLERASEIDSFVERHPMVNRNQPGSPKWSRLEPLLGDYLARYGYL
jgi:hypothetical protein